jgi:hypothetical protein
VAKKKSKQPFDVNAFLATVDGGRTIVEEVTSLRATWSKRLEVRCSICGETHKISVRETYIESVLRDARDAFRSVGEDQVS